MHSCNMELFGSRYEFLYKENHALHLTNSVHQNLFTIKKVFLGPTDEFPNHFLSCDWEYQKQMEII